MRPAPNEFNEYYGGYIDQVPDCTIADKLAEQKETFAAFVRNIPADKLSFAYAADKWTVGQVILHLIDAERVFAYRLLNIIRGDKTPLPGFDQNQWANRATAAGRTAESLAEEFEGVRAGTLSLLENATNEEMTNMGTASGFAVSARALAWIIAGHTTHHQRIINNRYLSA